MPTGPRVLRKPGTVEESGQPAGDGEGRAVVSPQQRHPMGGKVEGAFGIVLASTWAAKWPVSSP